MGLLDTLKRLLVGEAGGTEAAVTYNDKDQRLTRQQVLDNLMRHFLEMLHDETTTESMLFHTSYIIYLPQESYERISPGFQITVRDCVRRFLREIKKRLKDYPDFKPFSNYWMFQLVAIPEGTVIDGISDEEMDDNLMLVKSTIFATDDIAHNEASGRIVTTMHTVNSMKAMPGALNLLALPGLVQLDKDKFRMRFDPENSLGLDSGGSGARFEAEQVKVLAELRAEDGRFVTVSGQPYSTYRLQSDELRISGRHAMSASRGVETLMVDSEEVMNPHVSIRRDPSSGRFSISAMGDDVKLNGRLLPRGAAHWTPLPNNSTIIINDDIQINFKIK